jgi:hypothetical protein
MRWLSLILSVACTFGQNASPAPAEQASALDGVRAYAANYTSSLPNYTCDQVTRRFEAPIVRSLIGPRSTPKVDVIEEQLSFVDNRETYKVMKINGRAAGKGDRAQIGGMFSQGEFGNLLRNTLDTAAGAAFKWERVITMDGRPVNVFGFRVPAARGYAIAQGAQYVKAAYEGRLFADVRSSEVLRIQMKCVDIPSDAAYTQVELTLDYKPTLVAGMTYMLPSHYRLHTQSAGDDATNEADYKSCRRFEASATITFEDEK